MSTGGSITTDSGFLLKRQTTVTLKASFFQQLNASAEQMRKMAELEPLLLTLLAFHSAQAKSLTPVWDRGKHGVVAAKIQEYVDLSIAKSKGD